MGVSVSAVGFLIGFIVRNFDTLDPGWWLTFIVRGVRDVRNLKMGLDGAKQSPLGVVLLFSARCLFTGLGSIEVCIASVHFLIRTICIFDDSASSSPSRGNERGLVSSPAGLKKTHISLGQKPPRLEETF